MAQGSRSSSRRSATSLPSSLDSLLSSPVVPSPVVTPQDILTQEAILAPPNDLRHYHPANVRSPPTPVRTANTTVIGRRFPSLRLAVPDAVAVCVRRKSRREVLFALNRQNRGRGSGKPRHRNRFTKVHC